MAAVFFPMSQLGIHEQIISFHTVGVLSPENLYEGNFLYNFLYSFQRGTKINKKKNKIMSTTLIKDDV